MYLDEWFTKLIEYFKSDKKYLTAMAIFQAKPYTKTVRERIIFSQVQLDEYAELAYILGLGLYQEQQKLQSDFLFSCSELTGEQLRYYAKMFGLYDIPISIINIDEMNNPVLYSESSDIQGFYQQSTDNPILVNTLDELDVDAETAEISDELIQLITCFNKQLFSTKGVAKFFYAFSILTNYFNNVATFELIHTAAFEYEIVYDFQVLKDVNIYDTIIESIYNQNINILFTFTQST